MSEIKAIEPISFACPECKRLLLSGENRLQCSECHLIYPIVDSITDFFSQDHLARDAKRIAKAIDFMAPIYESRLFPTAAEPFH